MSGCPQKGLITQLRSKEVRRWPGGLFDQRGNKPGKVSSLCQQFRAEGGGGDGILSVIRMSAKTTTILHVTSYIFNIFNREKETEFGPPFCINVAINGGLSGRDWR